MLEKNMGAGCDDGSQETAQFHQADNSADHIVDQVIPAAIPFYVASDIKRFRRTKADMGRIRAAIIEILSADNPQTVRQVFYALTVRGVIDKHEVEYQRTAVRLLSEMREDGTIPFEW